MSNPGREFKGGLGAAKVPSHCIHFYFDLSHSLLEKKNPLFWKINSVADKFISEGER